jgi:uncharacterized membrane protein YoaK (UPF0700 family)
MPVNYARTLTAPTRTRRANLHLGVCLAFVAGATNAGAALAVHQYTSHMTGMVSSLADALVLRQRTLAVSSAGALVAFTLGAATTSVIVNFGRHRGFRSAFAQPLALEAALLLVFGLVGGRLDAHRTTVIPATVALLCFTMGLQNALVTKISNAEVRTTHVTGLVTDIGIELGRLVFLNRITSSATHPSVADTARLATLSVLLLSFLVGGVSGAAGFQAIGFLMTVPLAALLSGVAAVPVAEDLWN